MTFASDVIADIIKTKGRSAMRAKIVMNEQVCRTCKELKPIGEYYLRSANSAGEKKPNLDCKLCTLAAIKAKKAQNV